MHEQKINKKYQTELFVSIFIYIVVLIVTIWFAKGMEDGLPRTLLVLLPLIPVMGTFWAIVRHFKRMDEYIRIWTLELIAMSGGITALFSLTYGLLEGVGFPKLSMTWSTKASATIKAADHFDISAPFLPIGKPSPRGDS